jgi:hypothetical protein
MDKTFKYFERFEVELRGFIDDSREGKNFNFGLFIGLLFGVFGNLFSTSLYELFLRNQDRVFSLWIFRFSLLIFLICGGIIFFLIFKYKKEEKVLQGLLNKVSRLLNDSLDLKKSSASH